MALALDPEIAAALAPMMAGMAEFTPPAVGDVLGRRPMTEAIMAQTAAMQPMPGDVDITDFATSTPDGAEILLRWYAPSGAAAVPGPAVVHLHGGGMIMGSVALYDGPVARYVSDARVPMLAVDYRVAPEHPFPAPVEDAYAGLRWLVEHAGELNVDPSRVAVMGDSGGGGLAAAVAILARDRGGPTIARQVLVYPMLDDRTVSVDPEIAPFAVWTWDDNVTAWGALLGEGAGGPDVPAHAAPARLADAAGLPPAYIEVGQLDIFRDEDLAYAHLLGRAGVPVEFHLHAGAPHEFETFAFDSAVARRSRADRIRVLQSL